MDNAQFFYRTVPFIRTNEEVALVDVFQMENKTPLDEWLGVVVSLADGFHTIQQMIDFLATQYTSPPENLEKTIHSVLERLVESKVIELSARIVTLPYYLSGPINELDIERAKQAVREEVGEPPAGTIH